MVRYIQKYGQLHLHFIKNVKKNDFATQAFTFIKSSLLVKPTTWNSLFSNLQVPKLVKDTFLQAYKKFAEIH